MDASIFDAFRQAAQQQNLQVLGVRAETTDGETAFYDFAPSVRRNVWSCAKTFTALVVGICVDKGFLAVGDRVLDFFPQYAATAAPGSDIITIRDMLHMAPGKTALCRQLENQPGADFLDHFMAAPMVAAPGEKFFYSSLYTYTLGRIVEKVAGQHFYDFAVANLLAPLGIESPVWKNCPLGHTHCAKELWLTTEELARLGTLFLHDGIYKGRRIVSSAYLHDMICDVFTAPCMDTPDPETQVAYGYQLWRGIRPGLYRAYGRGGNFCIIMPDRGLAVTVTADCSGNDHDIARLAELI